MSSWFNSSWTITSLRDCITLLPFLLVNLPNFPFRPSNCQECLNPQKITSSELKIFHAPMAWYRKRNSPCPFGWGTCSASLGYQPRLQTSWGLGSFWKARVAISACEWNLCGGSGRSAAAAVLQHRPVRYAHNGFTCRATFFELGSWGGAPKGYVPQMKQRPPWSRI